MPQMIRRSLSSNPSPIHRVNVRIKHHHVHVPNQNRKSSQYRLVKMQRRSSIGNPFRKMPQSEIVEPQNEAAGSHHHRAPQKRPIFHLLRVAERAKSRRRPRKPEIVKQQVAHISQIADSRHQAPQNHAIPPHQHQVNHVIGKRHKQHHRRHAMQRPSKCKMLLPLPHRPRPPGVGIFKCESCNHQHGKTDHREPVRNSKIEIHPLHFFAGINPRPFAKKLP